MRICGGIFDLEPKKARIEELDKIMSAPGFWEDAEKTKTVARERSALLRAVDEYEHLISAFEESETYLELMKEGEAGLEAELKSSFLNLEKKLSQMEVLNMLSGEYDINNAILSINSGAGGTESMDWAHMLFRMYTRWCEKEGHTVKVLDYQPGEEAGIKSVTISVEGDYAYGYLKAENGIHRLVRISPFDANARRHTSFAAVYSVPEIDDDIEIEINDKDLRIDTYRSSGAGGQHVNVTDSAVRITHLPTGIVVSCQNERSQHKNKDVAMKVLKARLYEHELQKKDAERKKEEDAKMDIAWGSQIRSYVLHPYRMIKDHRTKVEVGNVDRILDGDLNEFMEAFLLMRKKND